MSGKERQREYQQQWYKKNRKRLIKKAAKRNIEHEQKMTEYVNSMKTQCEICGETRKPCLVFHHRNPKDKVKCVSIMRRRYSKDKIKAEIEKCVVLCANCHRMLHHENKGTVSLIGKLLPLQGR